MVIMVETEQDVVVQDEFADDLSDDGSLSELTEEYPRLPNKCIKDAEPALLQNCSVRRMRDIATAFDGIDNKLQKVPLFKALFDAMSHDQDCNICEGGICQPRSHVFPPYNEPPPRSGVDGTLSSTRRSQQPPVSGLNNDLVLWWEW